ncbi:hypothetical protein CDD80_5720 [Ophiocordyceps camponoti-rufipedis]|uniref:Uncharacterized protein n=1 Tax=Ophiocordyceps camponoti-rufipedis TaxID=2004952 RepID=A0A2C5YUV6_9HYPO|nr:hypothetical protein CDD80_5720 [Ophiocordyceps camponoti-rufipedis]
MVRASSILAALAAGVTFATRESEMVLQVLEETKNSSQEISVTFKPDSENMNLSMPCPEDLGCQDKKMKMSFVSGPTTFSMDYPGNIKVEGGIMNNFAAGCVCSQNVGTCSLAATVEADQTLVDDLFSRGRKYISHSHGESCPTGELNSIPYLHRSFCYC